MTIKLNSRQLRALIKETVNSSMSSSQLESVAKVSTDAILKSVEQTVGFVDDELHTVVYNQVMQFYTELVSDLVSEMQ